MNGPYVKTKLETIIELEARQMDNNIYKNLKSNLIDKLEGFCFEKYGYITKIYEIIEKSRGIIIPENPKALALFNVKFSCKLCNPIINKEIICKIEKINNRFINAVNGPITTIITMETLANTNFMQNQKTGNLLYKKDDKIIDVGIGSYIKIFITSKLFSNNDTIIMTLGKISELATDEEIKNSYQEQFEDNDDKIVEFENYIYDEKNKEKIIIKKEEKDKLEPND
jgi:DNA-directed RNA polymerase subunit E'/Rpb7